MFLSDPILRQKRRHGLLEIVTRFYQRRRSRRTRIMKHGQRMAVLTLLDREMLAKGSWCGETHIQKATYFLQELLGVDLGFEFVLYRHGPFSFELRDELSSMQADDILT